MLLVDDGLATGATMRAAVRALRRKKPASIIVAVPTAARSTCDEFQDIADACICTITPEPFRAVGLWYENFEQVSDEEVCDRLAGRCDQSDLERADDSPRVRVTTADAAPDTEDEP